MEICAGIWGEEDVVGFDMLEGIPSEAGGVGSLLPVDAGGVEVGTFAESSDVEEGGLGGAITASEESSKP